MQKFIHLNNATRPVLTSLLLIVLMLFNIVPSNAQSDPAMSTDPAAVDASSTDTTTTENLPFDPASEVFNAAIAVPEHVSPAPDSLTTTITDPPVGVPSLTWSAVQGATRYNVQISVSAGFATTLVNQNTVATTYTPQKVFADGIYFWRVRAEVDKAWGSFSEPWSFTKDWSNGGAIKPQLIAPAHDPDGRQPITSFSPEQFSWESIPGATAYLLEISVSPTFNDVKPYQVTTVKTHHTPTSQFTNNQYHWRVTPLDYRGNAGLPSEKRIFTFRWNQIPLLLTPANDVDSRFIPRFTWTAVPGAEDYILEISSQGKFSEASIVETVRTANTSYTPAKALSNDKDYFWRVRAVSPQNISGPDSEVRTFHTNWIEPPVLLSPPSLSIMHIYPFFSWTPVAGAERYQLQIATGTGFDNVIEDVTLYNATSYSQGEWPKLTLGGDYFWHVRAKDAEGNTTEWSDEGSFRIVADPPPNLIYPEPYYQPDAEGMPVHTNRTIAHPVFVWDTSHEYVPTDLNKGNGPTAFVYPDYYHLEVASDLQFNNIVFSIDSAGQAAAPTQGNPITPLTDGVSYYWRVTPIRAGDSEVAQGTVWETRIDRTVPQLPLDTDGSPDVVHPQEGYIAVGAPPVLGWLPVANATYYEVKISSSRDLDASVVDSANALFAYYVPWQGRQEPMPTGVYWWRVRAKDAANEPLGDWSEERHFFVMDELITGNKYDYLLPKPGEGTLLSPGDPILYDPALSLVATSTLTAAAPYNLGALHIAQDRSISSVNRNWVIAFGVDESVATPVTYALYVDVNQQHEVGGGTDPRDKAITTDPLYRPDYVIYLDRTGDEMTDAAFHRWNGSEWEGPFSLSGLGGSYGYDATSQAVQVIFPYARIVLEDTDQFSGGLAFTVYSTDTTPGTGPRDSVPQQGPTLEYALLAKPALVSNIPMLLFPFDTPSTNPTVFHELPALRWRMPRYNSTDGYKVEVARSADFTQDTIVESWQTYENSTGSFYGAIPTAFHSGESYNDNESYYWRVSYRHERFATANEYDTGPWSPPMRFKLISYVPSNPTVTLGEVAQATPSFAWERVEGAAGYTIQIGNDFNLNNPLVDKEIDGNSFTPTDTLADGTYYWRVAMRRSDNVLGQWTSTMSFTKSSLVPTLLNPTSNPTVAGETGVTSTTVINHQPTFIWTATISNTDELHIAAPRYRLQWDDNEQFTSPTSVETEATSYTPIEGQSLNDGTWFWRVAVIDGSGQRGRDSAVATFYKEYLRPEMLSPVQGSNAGETITFEWTPLDGAAYYKLEIDDNEAFDSPIRVSTDNTRYTHIATLPPDEYYWRVQMVDQDDKPGPTVPGRFSQGPDTPDNVPSVFMPFVLAPTGE